LEKTKKIKARLLPLTCKPSNLSPYVVSKPTLLKKMKLKNKDFSSINNRFKVSSVVQISLQMEVFSYYPLLPINPQIKENHSIVCYYTWEIICLNLVLFYPLKVLLFSLVSIKLCLKAKNNRIWIYCILFILQWVL
jgi:hypothetical protein